MSARIEKKHDGRIDRPVSPEAVALAVRWARDEVTLLEVQRGLGLKNRSFGVYIRLARALRQAVRDGALGLVIAALVFSGCCAFDTANCALCDRSVLFGEPAIAIEPPGKCTRYLCESCEVKVTQLMISLAINDERIASLIGLVYPDSTSAR